MQARDQELMKELDGMDTKEELSDPEDYTVRKVDLDTGKSETKKVVLPKSHMNVIKKQMKLQAKKIHNEYVEEKNKAKRRAKSKNARKARKK